LKSLTTNSVAGDSPSTAMTGYTLCLLNRYL